MSDQSPTSRDLGRVITTPSIRQAIYGGYVVLLAVLGATSAGFAALKTGYPDWLTVANSAAGYLGIPIGGLAAANVTTRRRR